LLFVGALAGYAYFCQGGGWSQNVRFAQVRAIVEERRLALDSYLIYVRAAPDSPTNRLLRQAVTDGTCRLGEKTYALAWHGPGGQLIPIADPPPAGYPLLAVDDVAASGDLAYHGGHFHPNKAPGTAFAAVPAYALLFGLERAVGLDPDDWWTLTVNAWLTAALSVGLVSALGCVLFFRLAQSLSGRRRDALLATLAFAAGTLYLPYATMLYEHNFVAVALLASFYGLYRTRHDPGPPPGWWLFLAGLAAGYAVLCNYLAAVVVVFLGLYLLSFTRTLRHAILYGLGVLVPLVLLGAYHTACFGTPFTTNYRFENPIFQADHVALLGVLELPQPDRLVVLLFSPFRGLFFTSPVLLAGLAGWVLLLRGGRFRSEAWLFAAIVVFFLLFNCSFNGWTGGYGVGPRYLVPALPFLALPLALAAGRFFRTTAVLTGLSVVLLFVATAVDPQCPLGVSGAGRVLDRAQWRYSPLTEYEFPFLVLGRPEPFLRSQADALWARVIREAAARGRSPGPRDRFDRALAQGDARLFPLAAWQGPVSVNPQGVYEAAAFQLFPPTSPQARWNSFNAGEFLFPVSRLSLLPLLVVCGGLALLGWRTASRQPAPPAGTGKPPTRPRA
jgi:hypothetical protein